jgi:hypothetical protein
MTDVDATVGTDAGAAGDVEQAGATEGDVAESFDPVGTAVLIGIYMAIVVLMWIFTYFIEFLGRGVTIVG